MKTTNYILFAALAALSLSVACSKEQNIGSPEKVQTAASESGKTITINATLPDATKVNFEAGTDDARKAKLILTWSQNDKLRVYDASKPDSYADFDLTSGAGTKVATFSGTAPEATSYDVAVINNATATQEQASDGDTGHLVYGASASGLSLEELKTIQFTSISSVLGLTAKLPAKVTETITSVKITASNNIFYDGNELEIRINTQADTDDDGLLKVFATMPMGDQTIPAGTELFIKFNSNNDKHKVYTRYYQFPAAKTLLGGKLNELRMDCSKTDQHAGLASCDGTTEAKAYLIADPYQVAAINGLAKGDQTTYFKMIDDVDMMIDNVDKKVVTHNPINTNSGYTQVVNFDGNGKTISNLGKHFFYVFKGSIKDLTLDHSDVTSRGIFAEYCQETGHTITNVTISNGSMKTTSANSGALIGRINNGTTGVTTVTINDCTVSGTDVSGAGIVGGVIGYADAQVNVNGSKFIGGTVTASGQYVGGFVGSLGNYASTVTDCRVEDATINVNYTADARGGGFAGIIQDAVTVSGCSVGTSAKKVTINTKEPSIKSGTTYNVINVGGFVGVCYGKITKNGEARSQAHVKITSDNTQETPLKLGGFVGYHSGTIEYSDAIYDMTEIKGQHIGGFAGYITTGAGVRYGKIDNCTAAGDVSGTCEIGGFAGYVDSEGAIISYCSSSGTVVSNNTTSNADIALGGLIGYLNNGSLSCNSSSVSINQTTNGRDLGGLVGKMVNGFISQCYASGDISGIQRNTGGLIGLITNTSGEATVSDCYSKGNVTANSYMGGLVGHIEQGSVSSISNCYSAANTVTAKSFNSGGLIGFMNSSRAKIEKCAAWNSKVTASSIGTGNWSSGAVIGTAFPTATLTDNYRNPSMALTAWWVPDADYQHPNVSATTPLIVKDKSTGVLRATTATALASNQDNYPLFAYHGKVEAGKTLSQLASTTLGWSSSVWDFNSGDLPKLRNNPEN